MKLNKRRAAREKCFARVVVQEIAGQLRDINLSGIKIVLFEECPLKNGDLTDALILSKEFLDIKDFSIKGKVMWYENDTYGQILGLEIEDFIDPDSRESYMSLLNYYRDSDEI